MVFCCTLALLQADNTVSGAIWPMVLEKAYARAWVPDIPELTCAWKLGPRAPVVGVVVTTKRLIIVSMYFISTLVYVYSFFTLRRLPEAGWFLCFTKTSPKRNCRRILGFAHDKNETPAYFSVILARKP